MHVWPIVALAALALLTLAPASALADSDRETPQLEMSLPEEVALGDTIAVEARLADPTGEPIEDVVITFLSPAAWGEGAAGHEHGEEAEEAEGHEGTEEAEETAGHGDGEEGEEADGHVHGKAKGEMVLGTALTDPSGVASITSEMRRSGDIEVIARFEGNDQYEAASASSSLVVEGSYQLYTPEVGVKIPGLGSWLLAAVIGGLWSLYFIVALLVFAIARSPAGRLVPAEAAAVAGPRSEARRRFLTRLLVPLGMQAVIASVGLGLVTLVVRSPYTHGNLKSYTSGSRYRRTPFASVGGEVKMREMPPALDREVSFVREVQPIFLTKGGPHAMPPDNSPPPHGVLLDSYEHIMEKEGLVIPGKPEESELVEVLLDPAIRMPPSVAPLSDEETQVIVSWIAQGARNT